MKGSPEDPNMIEERWYTPKNSPHRWNTILFAAMQYHFSWDWLMPVIADVNTLIRNNGSFLFKLQEKYPNYNKELETAIMTNNIKEAFDLTAGIIYNIDLHSCPCCKSLSGRELHAVCNTCNNTICESCTITTRHPWKVDYCKNCFSSH